MYTAPSERDGLEEVEVVMGQVAVKTDGRSPSESREGGSGQRILKTKRMTGLACDDKCGRCGSVLFPAELAAGMK